MFRSRPNREAVFLVGEKVGQLIAVAVVNVVVLRQLGPQTAGFLSAATAALAIALPLSNFGQVPVLRELATDQAHRATANGLVRFGVVLGIFGSLLGAGLLFLFGTLMPTGPTQGLILVLSGAFLARPLWSVDAWYKASGFNSRAAVIRVVGVYVGALGRVFIALTSQSLVGLALFIVAENVVSGLLFLADYFRKRPRVKRSALSSPVRRRVIVSSIPMLISGLATLLYMRVDQPMLLYLADSREVGLYSAAANLSDAVSFVPVVLSAIVSASAFKLYVLQGDFFSIYMRRLMGLAAGFAYIIATFGIALSGPVVRVLYGSEYDSSSVLLQILLCAVPFIFVGVIHNIWVVASNLQYYQLCFTITAAVINIVANVFLIPHFGALGAAWSTVFSHMFANIVGNALFSPTRVIMMAEFRALDPRFALRMVWLFLKSGGNFEFLKDASPDG